jgi:sulfatase maturation enzyme AslB (radical SAM superfamily)
MIMSMKGFLGRYFPTEGGKKDTEPRLSPAQGSAITDDLVRCDTPLEAEEKRLSLVAEETSLSMQLEADPENVDLLQRLCTVLGEQDRPIPMALEERTLIGHLRREPDRTDLRNRLDIIQHRLGKLPPERENLMRLADLQARDYKPTNLYVQITNHCNLRCAMCGHRTAIKDNALMGRALFDRVLDEAEASNVINLFFAAAFGETLLHPDAFEYMAEAVRRGFKVTVATNGNYLSPEQIERLATAQLSCIQYSFFGYDAASYEKTYIRGNFDKARENLRLLKAAMVRAGTSTQLLVNGINLYAEPERTRKTRALLASIGIEEHEIRLSLPNNFGGVISPGTRQNTITAKSYKNVDELPLQLCNQLLWTPGILADGRMTACGCLDNNGSLAIGNIQNNTIAEMRHGERYQRIIEAFLSGDLSEFPICKRCDVPYGRANERPA